MSTKRRLILGLGVVFLVGVFLWMRAIASWRPVLIGVHLKADTLEVSPDGKWILSKITRYFPIPKKDSVRLTDLASRKTRANDFVSDVVSWAADSRLGVRVEQARPPHKAGDYLSGISVEQPKTEIHLIEPSDLSQKIVFQGLPDDFYDAFQDWRTSPDGKILWTLTSKRWRQFDARTGEQQQIKIWRDEPTLPNAFGPNPAQLSPDGTRVLMSPPYMSCQKWEIGNLTPQTVRGKWSRFQFAGNDFYLVRKQRIWALRRWRDDAKIFNIFGGTIWKLTPDEHFLGIVRAQDIRWFDLTTGKWVESTRRPAQIGRSISFSSDRNFAFTLMSDGKIWRWRLR